MHFRLMNVRATFERTLDIIFRKYNWKTCLEYFDRFIILSNDMQSHVHDVDNTFYVFSPAAKSLNLK